MKLIKVVRGRKAAKISMSECVLQEMLCFLNEERKGVGQGGRKGRTEKEMWEDMSGNDIID